MDTKQPPGQRSMSAEPQPVTDRPDTMRSWRLSARISPVPRAENEPEGRTSSSLRIDEDKITPTAKVSAWLETLPSDVQINDDDDDTSQVLRDAVDITASKLCSSHLQPISVDMNPLEGQGDTKSLDHRRGKAIPPISASKVAQMAGDKDNVLTQAENDAERLRVNFLRNRTCIRIFLYIRATSFCDDDICTSRATIDSETSSTTLSSQNNTESTSTKTKPGNEDNEGPHPEQFRNDVIIQVKEVNKTADATDVTMTTKQKEVVRHCFIIVKKLFGRPVGQEPGTSGAAKTEGAKLSFSGVANTLLQWKLNKARAVKRRSQSIAMTTRAKSENPIDLHFKHKSDWRNLQKSYAS
ncbi:hypothetical protein QZH41_011751 [Actinostola sp. cb2023]|nr:hypothetical protein QZH41_011751 [Actinostola sp. cb2023]